jgi:hypothetical protein
MASVFNETSVKLNYAFTNQKSIQNKVFAKMQFVYQNNLFHRRSSGFDTTLQRCATHEKRVVSIGSMF